MSETKKLYYKTYLQVLHNSVGTEMFRNFYVCETEHIFDAMADGSNSCAFYVSGVLTMFGKATGIHGTVQSTVKDLLEHGWSEVDELRPGDVIVWEARHFDDGTYEHIGFCLDGETAVSTSWTKKKVVKHDLHFGEAKRPIVLRLRLADW